MGEEFQYEYFSDVKHREVEWFWYPYIPYGKLTVLQGDPGEGKTTFMLNVAALATRGEAFPDGYRNEEPLTVIFQCAEDDVADTVKPRLLAAGADCSRVAYIVENATTLTLDDSRIERVIIETEARLIVLDPIQAFLSQDGDMQSAVRMRSILRKLAAMAEQYHCAIVLVGHMNKGTSGKNIYRSLGSIDIVAIARSVLMVRRNCTDSTVRYMVPVKSSLAPEGQAIAFTFDGDRGFQWIGPCEMEDDVLLSDGGSEDTKRTCAGVFLKELLAKEDILSVEIMEEMNRLGFSRRTVFAAKKDIGAEAYRKDNAWYWSLALEGEDKEDAE